MKKVRVAVAVITDPAGNILLTQRNSPETPSTHMRWQLPGGGINPHEKISDACIREAREETGFVVRLEQQVPIKIRQVVGDTLFLLHGFKAIALSGTINVSLDEETADAKWYSREEIKGLECLPNTGEMIDKCLKN